MSEHCHVLLEPPQPLSACPATPAMHGTVPQQPACRRVPAGGQQGASPGSGSLIWGVVLDQAPEPWQGRRKCFIKQTEKVNYEFSQRKPTFSFEITPKKLRNCWLSGLSGTRCSVYQCPRLAGHTPWKWLCKLCAAAQVQRSSSPLWGGRGAAWPWVPWSRLCSRSGWPYLGSSSGW